MKRGAIVEWIDTGDTSVVLIKDGLKGLGNTEQENILRYLGMQYWHQCVGEEVLSSKGLLGVQLKKSEAYI